MLCLEYFFEDREDSQSLSPQSEEGFQSNEVWEALLNHYLMASSKLQKGDKEVETPVGFSPEKPTTKLLGSHPPSANPLVPGCSSLLYLHEKMIRVLGHREDETIHHNDDLLEPMHHLVKFLWQKGSSSSSCDQGFRDTDLEASEGLRRRVSQQLSASQAEIRQTVARLPLPKKAKMNETLAALVEKRDRNRQKLRDILLSLLQEVPAASGFSDGCEKSIQQRLKELQCRIAELEDLLEDCTAAKATSGPYRGMRVFALPSQSFPAEDGPSVREVIDVYHQWLAKSSTEALQRTTDTALMQLRQFLQFSSLLLPLQITESGADAKQYTALTYRVNQAMDAELKCYQGSGSVSTFPVQMVLSCAELQLRSMRQEAAFLLTLGERLEQWQKECESIETAMCLLPECEPCATNLIEARDELLEVQWVLQDETIKFERAQHHEQVDDGCIAALEAAKLKVRHHKSNLLAVTQKALELENDFPEMGWYIGAGVPQALLPFWDSNRKLLDFEDVQALQGQSRNTVYQATYGGQRFAIKEFTPSGLGLEACLQEAGHLVRAAHPHIVEIKAVFQDPSTHIIYMQMPFYEGGPLDRWVEEQRPSTTSLRRIMLQVFEAVGHLHGLGIIHADLKPSNILLSSKGCVRIGDFDASVDETTCTSTSSITTLPMTVGYPPGFAAPELLQTGATKATDVFSLGAIVATLPPSPDSTARTEEQSQVFAAKLCLEDPSKRPTVVDATADEYFAPAIEWQRVEVGECCVMASTTCDFGDRCCPLSQGVECTGTTGAVHFICDGCLQQYVIAFISADLRLQMQQEGHVWCPICQCSAASYDDTQLACHLPAELFTKYLGVRMQLLEKQQAEAHEQQFKMMLAAELQRLAQLDEEQRQVLLACRHITENILNHRCPRCGQVYVDFDGCCALQCSRCPCAFCAWCGKDCGSEAHSHVALCAAKPPRQGTDLFAQKPVLDEHYQKRHRQQVKEYLDQLDVRLREGVTKEIQVALRHLGLWPL